MCNRRRQGEKELSQKRDEKTTKKEGVIFNGGIEWI